MRLVLALDKRCGQAAQAASEPIIAQMRLAWWRDVLSDAQAGKGEPLVEALRSAPQFAGAAPHLGRIVDGWEEWAVGGAQALAASASARGGGLFHALGAAGESDRAGALWALWDMGGREPKALELAQKYMGQPLPRNLPASARILARLAQRGIANRRGRPIRFTPGLYLAVLRAQFLHR